jgi:NitT/TauT family transport system ATP-binding protein
MTGETAIRIKDVSHQFGEPGEARHVRALRDTSLDVARGELLCLIGPSGCGKSTLLNVIGGLMTPTTGTVEVAGKRIAGPMPREIAFVFQESALFPWSTVLENVDLGMVFQGVPRQERAARARASLEAVGLTDFAQHYPAQLSGGMRQRVCIARTIVAEPRLILLDEPFGALDQQTRLLMGDEMLRLWRQIGATVFLITHALDEAAMLADRIMVMSARPGKAIDLVETGWPRERDSRIVERENFGALTAHLWKTLREESLKTMGRAVGGA